MVIIVEEKDHMAYRRHSWYSQSENMLLDITWPDGSGK